MRSGIEPKGDQPEQGAEALVSWPLAALVLAVLVGAAFRYYRLSVQPGLHFDEAANGLDILGLLQGNHPAGRLPIFFPENRGREPLFIYWQAAFVAMLGLSPFALRLAAAFVGVLTIPATYFVGHELFLWLMPPRTARWAGVLAASLLAVGYWHVALSRVGLRAITLPLFTCLAAGLLLRALRRERWRDFAFAGAVGGLAMYTYYASRLLPALPAVLGLLVFAVGPSRRRASQLLLTAIVWLAVFAPLGGYYLGHLDATFGRIDEVSIFNAANSGGQPLSTASALLRAVRDNFKMVSLDLSSPAAGLFGGRSAFDIVAGFGCWLGLALAIVATFRFRRDWHSGRPGRASRAIASAFLLAWLVDQIAPSFLTAHAPYYLRMMGALPALAILSALGLDWLSHQLERVAGARAGAVLALLLVVASAGLTYRDYFVVWLPSPTARIELMAEKVEAAKLLVGWTADQRVFLAPLYYQDYTVRLMARAAWSRIQTFDSQSAAVVPSGEPALYVFPAIDQNQPLELQRRLGPAATLETVIGTDGKPLLRVVRLAPHAADSTSPPLATLEGTIDLVGASVEPAILQTGGDLHVSLRWRARQKLPQNYTVFVHLRDASAKTVAQQDGFPGHGSYPTLWWQPGDTIVDDYTLRLPPDAPPGEYHVVVGMYRPEDVRRLALSVGDQRVAGDELTIGALQVTIR